MMQILSRKSLCALALLAAVGVGIIYEAPHLLIKKNLSARGLPYLPITLSAYLDEAQIYAPQIEEASRGNHFFGDPALLEHARDPSFLAPLGPYVLGKFVRMMGMEQFWFLSDAIFPPLIFLLFVAIAYILTRNTSASLLAAGLLIFFRQIGSFFPPSTSSQFKTFVAQFIPYVRPGHFTTHLAFGRFLTPEWTFIPLSAFFLLWIISLLQKKWFYSIAAGIFYGLLFYSYPFDAIAISLILGAFLLVNLIARNGREARSTLLLIVSGMIIAIPYWLNLNHLATLPYYHELLNRPGIEVGRMFRWSLLPHYLLWLPAAIWLFRMRKRELLALPACALYLGAFLTMNLQLVTGYLPNPKLFMSYSLALPLWAAHLISGKILLTAYAPYLRRWQPYFWALAILAFGLIFAKNIQIPFGYAREQASQFTLPATVVNSFYWIKKNIPRDAVILSPAMSTNTHLLVFTPVKVFFPPTGIITTASNKELVERFFIAGKLYGLDDTQLRATFASEAIYLILHNGSYTQEFDKSQSGAPLRNFDDMWQLFSQTQARWDQSPNALINNYTFDYVYVGPDEKRDYLFSAEKFPFCLSKVLTEGEVDIYARCAQ